MSKDTINTIGSDLDLFAHNVNYKQYLKDLNYFEQGLIKEKMKSIKSITEKNATTHFLIFSQAF